jgi:hypothetical protein
MIGCGALREGAAAPDLPPADEPPARSPRRETSDRPGGVFPPPSQSCILCVNNNKKKAALKAINDVMTPSIIRLILIRWWRYK